MDPFLGELKLVGFSFPPRGWLPCEGQLLSINQNQALFALLGTIYGGDGRNTFALPDLRDRVPVGVGPSFPQGAQAGETTVTLSAAQLPAHTHAAAGNAEPGTQAGPGGGYWAASGGGNAIYGANASATMAADAIAASGGGQPHPNRQPYQCLYWVIATEGVFPSRA